MDHCRAEQLSGQIPEAACSLCSRLEQQKVQMWYDISGQTVWLSTVPSSKGLQPDDAHKLQGTSIACSYAEEGSYLHSSQGAALCF